MRILNHLFKVAAVAGYSVSTVECVFSARNRLSEGFIVLMAVCSVRSSCVLYLVVVSMVVLSQAVLCPVVREWWAGADWLWEKSSGLCKWSLEWDSRSLILLKF